MRKHFIWALCVLVGAIVGCGQKQAAASGPVQGTVNMEGLTLDQKIEKIRNDKSIPEQYKETYINSLKAQAGQR